MTYSPAAVRFGGNIVLFATFLAASADCLVARQLAAAPVDTVSTIISTPPGEPARVVRLVESGSPTGFYALCTGIMTLATLVVNNLFADRKSARETDTRFEALKVEAERKDLVRQREMLDFRAESARLVAEAKVDAAKLVAQTKEETRLREEEEARRRHEIRDKADRVIDAIRIQVADNADALKKVTPPDPLGPTPAVKVEVVNPPEHPVPTILAEPPPGAPPS